MGKEQGGDKATKGPEAPVRSLDFALSESWRSWPSVERGVTWYDLHVSKVDSATVWKMVPGWELGGQQVEESGGCGPSDERQRWLF